MVYKDPHDDEYYKREILKLLRKKELIRSQMYKALGAKIKAEQLTRVLEALSKEGKISYRTLQRDNYPKAWGLVDHPEQVSDRESKKRWQEIWDRQQERYRAAAREKQAREDWHAFLTQMMVSYNPDEVYGLVCTALHRATERRRSWLHSTPTI